MMKLQFSDGTVEQVEDIIDLLGLVNTRLDDGRMSNFDVEDDEGEVGTAYWMVDGERGDWSTEDLRELWLKGENCTLVFTTICWKYYSEHGLWGFDMVRE